MDWSAGKGFLSAGGTRLEYACWGPAPDQAPTIVLLHEGLGCVALWRDFPAKLAKATGMGVLAYSRAGYGQSDGKPLPWSINYMTDEAVEVLPLVLDAIGFRSGILMGHSDGASIASIYCGSVEDMRVRGLIVMAPHYFTEPMGLAAIAQAKVAYDQGDLKPRLAKYHKDVDNAFRGWNNSWLNPDFEAWNIGDVEAGGSRTVSFQVGITPSLSQVGQAPTLVSDQRIFGFDRFTRTQIERTSSAITTKTNASSQQGTVVP